MRATPRLPLPAALVVLLATAAATARAGAPGPAEDAVTRRLQRAVGQLRQEQQLASGKGFYLRLDATRQRLALMLQGVVLDEYPVARLEWGVPEVLFVDRRPPADWDVAGFSQGQLEPARGRDRIEVVAPAPGAASAAPASSPSEAASPSPPPVPKSAEEAYSVPSPYRIVFAEGVSLELRAEGPAGRNRGLGQRLVDRARLRLSDLASALGLGARERVRLRLTLEAEHAASLYRSLPPDVGLIVVGLAPR
jgi:pyruvate/2-oxoglutarate dehydrogenase complex dihydrolipoamide acyltransferase (E2) component